MDENDPLFSSWKCSGFAMTPLQVRNDSKFYATGSQWASLLYLEYFINKGRTETNIERSYCYNVLKYMKNTLVMISSTRICVMR